MRSLVDTFMIAGIGDAIMEPIVRALCTFALWVLNAVMWVIETSPEPDLGNVWFKGQYASMLRVAMYLIIPFALLATIGAVFKGGLAEVLRTYLLGIPVAMLGAAVAIGFISLLQVIDQNFVDALMGQMREDFGGFMDALAANQELPDEERLLMPIALAFLFFLVGVGAIFIWIELIFRTVMIYLSVLFLPIAFAAFVWKPARRWFIGLAEIVGVSVFAKFVIVAVLTFGMAAVRAALGQGWADDTSLATGIGIFASGAFVIFIAAFATPALIAFVMAPNFQATTRKEFGTMTPLNADRQYARDVMGRHMKGLGSAVKGGGSKGGGS